MSSTSNVQDLLVNVFRPTYQYTEGVGFTPSLSLSNITEINTRILKAQVFSISDLYKNTYVGSNAGPTTATLSTTASNTGIGYSALGSSVNTTNNVAVGVFALNALCNSSNNTAVGSSNSITGAGQSNILVGRNITMGSGSNNILIGVDLSVGDATNRFRLGNLLYGDLSSGFVGVNTSAPAAAFDISGITLFRGKVGFQNPDPQYSLDVNGSVYANLQFIGETGTQQAPLFTFRTTPGTGMYAPPASADYGTGAFGISTSGEVAAIFASNKVIFTKDLSVNGTFSACNVSLAGFNAQDGTASGPTITFANARGTGFFLVDSSAIGFTTAGVRKMVLLDNGDLSAGRILASDISYSGRIFGSDPTSCNVIGGVTLSNGNVILTGVATNTNLLVPGWIRNTDPATTLDISGGTISNSALTRSSNFRGSNGSVAVPTYSFVSDPSTGIHLAGTSRLTFDTAGVQRMVISNGNVGIGTSNPVVALEVVGDVSAVTYNGPGGTAGAPHYTFSDDRTTGIFFPGANIVGLTAGGLERMRISNSNIGINTTAPTNALDVSGTLRVIGRNGNITFSNGTIDVSGTPLVSDTGAFSNASTTSNQIGGVTLSSFDLCMSTTGRILGMNGTSNRIGGVTLSNFDLCMASTGRILGMAGTSNFVGGVTLSNFDLCMASTGRILGMNGTSNRIGGVTLSNFDLCMASTGRIFGMSGTSNFIGGVTLSNFDLCMASTGRIFGMAGTSNQIGGVTLSNFDLCMTATGRILAPILRDSLTPSAYDISGGTISNSALTQSSNFRGSNGSVPVPTYSFLSDPSTGIHWAGTSQLAFDTAGFQRMVLSNSVLALGRTPVADASLIFQTAPNAYLATGRVYLGDPANSTPAYGAAIIEGQSNNAGGGGACDLLFYSRAGGTGVGTDPRERMRIVGQTGWIGINTTAPSSVLDVSGTLRVGAGLGEAETTSNTASIELGGGLNGNGVGGIPAIAFQGRDGTGNRGYRHFIQTMHSGGSMSTANAIRVYLNTGATSNVSTAPRTGNAIGMSITRVGTSIGSEFPAAWLDVSGDTTTHFGRIVRIGNPGNENGWGGRVAPPVDISGGVRIVQDASLGGTKTFDPRSVTDSLSLMSTKGQASNGTASIVFRSALDNNFYGRIYGIDTQTVPSSTFQGDLVFQTGFGAALVERMRITSVGQVGIGRTPTSSIYLDVSGAMQIQRNLTGGLNMIRFAHGGYLDSNDNASVILGIGASGVGAGNTGGDLQFNTYDNSSGPLLLPAMTLTRTTGRLGIGTTTPNYQLDVNGTMAANSNEYTIYVTATSNVSVPTGFTQAHVTLVGAGGGGGGGSVAWRTGAGGGGSGWRVEQIITSPATMTVSIGAGGAGGSSGGSNGATGGDTTLAYSTFTIRAKGGSGGLGTTTTTGAAGGAGYFGGGGGGGGFFSGAGQAGGAGGAGTIESGFTGVTGISTSGGAGGQGGGASGNGGDPGTDTGGGGGGGGPLGGKGAKPGPIGSNVAATAGGPGCGGGGGCITVGVSAGAAGGAGYAIIKFLR